MLFIVGLFTGLSLVFGLVTRLGAALGLLQAIVITLFVANAPGEWLYGYLMLDPALGADAAPARLAPHEPRRRARPRSLKSARGSVARSGPRQYPEVMCGIAGFTIAPGVELERTALARLLLAGIAERGTDATGYGYHRPDGTVEVHKESLRLREFVEHVDVPGERRRGDLPRARVHQGRAVGQRQQPPGALRPRVVVHNGHLDNDDALFRRHGVPRSTPHITVDSEAIAMLADRSGDIAEALTEVRGSAAVGVLWDGEPGRLTLARRASRPLCLGHGDGFVLFASTAGAARARSAGHGTARARSRRSRRAARWNCARASSSRAAASTSTAATSARRSSRTRRWPRSRRCCASRSPRSSGAASTSRCRRARPSPAC